MVVKIKLKDKKISIARAIMSILSFQLNFWVRGRKETSGTKVIRIGSEIKVQLECLLYENTSLECRCARQPIHQPLTITFALSITRIRLQDYDPKAPKDSHPRDPAKLRFFLNSLLLSLLLRNYWQFNRILAYICYSLFSTQMQNTSKR
jgi:hypothetical protein